MASNLAALQKTFARRPAAEPQSVATATATAPQDSPAGKTPNQRNGRVNITAYLPPDYKSSLRLIQARTGMQMQDIIAEALNDVFAKYDVPVIRGD